MSTYSTPSFSPALRRLLKIRGTVGLIIINTMVFIVCAVGQGSEAGDDWTLHLLRMGAQFNPLTLDTQWYRIFTHMFLHGGILHLALNMYALFSVGSELERILGTKKFLTVYLVCGVAAALNSLYWSLFTIGVGASGAIFGLFGFSFILNLFLSRRRNQPMTPLFLNFVFFLGLNLLMARALRADNAAHFGGLIAGATIGAYSLLSGSRSAFRTVRVEYLCIPVLLITWFLLPRFQVSYYKFFQYVIALEDSTQLRLEKGRNDHEFLEISIQNIHQWDTALQMLNSQRYLPIELAADTFKLRRYIGLRKKENVFRKTVIERESYIYFDSLAFVQSQMSQYIGLDYSLAFGGRRQHQKRDSSSATQPVKVWYDEDWIEVPSPPAPYYRIGFKDSLGRWNGVVQDFYENGAIQMKGTYQQDKRHGVFLFYSDHNTYTSAGRFHEDKSVGKWETFHNNGALASETYYHETYYVKSLWDSLGNQMVIEGHGKETRLHENGFVAHEGFYRNGLKEGYWYGRHPNGDIYFEEMFSGGRLVSGRSRNLQGQISTYDASSLFPIPEGGSKKFEAYVASKTKDYESDTVGVVHLSFRVTAKQALTDVKVEKSLTPAADAKAKAILFEGPRWTPARLHGHQPVDGFAFVRIDFR